MLQAITDPLLTTFHSLTKSLCWSCVARLRPEPMACIFNVIITLHY